MSATAIPTATRLGTEARLRPRFAGLAVLAGLLLLGAAIVQMFGPHAKVDEATLDLIVANKRAGLDILAAAIDAVGSLAIAGTLLFLLASARARNPQVAGVLRIVVIVGAVLAAISSLVYAIVISHKAHQFVTSGNQTYVQAHQVTSSGGLVAFQVLGLLGALLVAVSLVLVSIQAMRVGLLTRFMGYLGIISGALVIFQVTPVPVVETYWFLALAVLLIGRWPSGEPPAWRSGKAEPWPSAQAMREQRIRAAGGDPAKGGRGRGGGQAKAGRLPAGKSGGVATAPAPAATESTAAAGAAAKRKRKRRR